jgi:carbohydrate-selective porin OprB
MFQFMNSYADKSTYGRSSPIRRKLAAGCGQRLEQAGSDQGRNVVRLVIQNGSAFSQAYETIHGHGLGGETTVELDYQYNPAPWFSLQPDLQFITDPGGDPYRSLMSVLGLRTIVRF